MAGKKKPERIMEKTKRLHKNGKVSDQVVLYKEKTRERMVEKLLNSSVDRVVVVWELIPD